MVEFKKAINVIFIFFILKSNRHILSSMELNIPTGTDTRAGACTTTEKLGLN